MSVNGDMPKNLGFTGISNNQRSNDFKFFLTIIFTTQELVPNNYVFSN